MDRTKHRGFLTQPVEIGEGIHVARDPRREILVEHRLDVGEVARPEHADEEDRRRRRAGGGIADRQAVAAEIDEALGAGAMELP